MRKFLCFFDVHKWSYKTEITKCYIQIKTRKCLCCEAIQFLEFKYGGTNLAEGGSESNE